MQKPFTTLFAVLVAACSTTDPSEGRFVTNERTLQAVDRAFLPRLRKAWTPDSMKVLTASRLSDDDKRWSLDFIANTESGGVRPCHDLVLLAVTHLDLQAFKVKNSRDEVVQYLPRTHYESWSVAACGETREWRLFDEATDPKNPLRVLLWRAAA
jgi:hypothetical protein